MIQSSSTSSNTRWQEIISIWRDNRWLYVIVGILLGILSVPALEQAIGDLNSLIGNLVPEAVGIVFTVLILDRLAENREREVLKSRLFNELRSSAVGQGTAALAWLQRENWIDEDSLVGADLHRINWESAYIGDLNLEGANLSGANLRNVSNQVTDADGTRHNRPLNLKNTSLRHAQLEAAVLVGADLRHTVLTHAHLKNAVMVDANMDFANLDQSDLEGANLTGVSLQNVQLNLANLQKAIIRESNLKGASLFESNLEGADLSSADLREAKLSKSRMKGARFVSANLEGIRMDAAKLEGALFISATLNHASLYLAYLVNASFNNADLTKLNLSQANLEAATLKNVNLFAANLSGANLSGADLREAKLDNVIWFERRLFATLPDGAEWTPEEDMGRFINSQHPKFDATREKINAIRTELGYKPI